MRLFRRITSATNVPQPAHMIKAPTIKGNICLFVSGGDGSIFRPSSSDLSIEVPPLLASADPLPGTVVVLSVDDGVAAVVVTLVVDVVVGAAVVVVDAVGCLVERRCRRSCDRIPGCRAEIAASLRCSQ